MSAKNKEILWTPVQVKLGDLELWKDNPVTLSKAQADQLLKSERKLGKLQTIAISPKVKNKHLVYDGHQRIRVWSQAYGADTKVWALQSSRMLNANERRAVPIMTRTATGSLDYGLISGWDAVELTDFGLDADFLADMKHSFGGLANFVESENPVFVLGSDDVVGKDEGRSGSSPWSRVLPSGKIRCIVGDIEFGVDKKLYEKWRKKLDKSGETIREGAEKWINKSIKSIL